MKMMLKLLATLFLFSISGLVSACSTTIAHNTKVSSKPALDGSDLFLPIKESTSQAEIGDFAVRGRVVDVDTTSLMSRLSEGEVTVLNLNFFKNASFRVVRKKQTVSARSGNITWVGQTPSAPGSFAILVVSSKGLDGSFDVPGEGLFTIRKLSSGNYIVEEIKRSALR